MPVQNISGADIITTEFSVNPEITSEQVQREEEVRVEEQPVPEEGTGEVIDTYA